MTNPRFRLRYVLVLYLMLSALNNKSVWGAESETNVDRFAKAYRAAHTEFERRAMCLEAIDTGIIARGRSVAVVDTIFGTNYAKNLPPTGAELAVGVVDFRPFRPSPSDKIAASHGGWYLAFRFDSTGTVQNYYLSNVHK